MGREGVGRGRNEEREVWEDKGLRGKGGVKREREGCGEREEWGERGVWRGRNGERGCGEREEWGEGNMGR